MHSYNEDARKPSPTVPPDHPDAGPLAAEFLPGDMIDGLYRVKQHIPGGMNDVYLCITSTSPSGVAVKRPRSNRHDMRSAAEQKIHLADEQKIFLAEVKNWADLREHPNVASCLYAGVSSGRWFLVLEWVGYPERPRSIVAAFAPDQEPSGLAREQQAIRLTRQVCSGLAYIHNNGIVHGDLKPENILLDKNGHAKITDLGISLKVTPGSRTWKRWLKRHADRREGRAGTALYMAPELWDGNSASVQSDIYALGCVLYEMVTGHPPFESADEEELGHLHKSQVPPAATASGDLARLIAQCLDKKPARRPASADAILARLTEMPTSDDQVQQLEPEEAVAESSSPLDFMRDLQHVSLTLASGRLQDAIEEQTAAIRAALGAHIVYGGHFATDKPDGSLAWNFNDRGLLLASSGNLLEANSDFITAIRFKPDFAVAYSNIGSCYQELRMPTLAIIAFNHAIDLDTKDHRLRLKRARLFAELGWMQAGYADCQAASTLHPDDPETCWCMADLLFGLGRGEEAAAYRAKSRELGGSEEAQKWLRPDRPTSPNHSYMQGITLRLQGEKEGVVEALTAALREEPWEIDIRYYRAESYLDSGEYSAALDDLNAFLDLAATTHPLAPRAKAMRERALDAVQEGNRETHQENIPEFPLIKGPAYISRRSGRRSLGEQTGELVNLLPIPADQRVLLFDMLYSGDADRKYRAEDLVWDAFDEQADLRTAQHQEKLAEVPPSEAGLSARDFTLCEEYVCLTVRNGLGLPCLLSEVQLSGYPLASVEFLTDRAPVLGWHTAGSAGIWNVVPALEIDRAPLADGAKAAGFAPDGSAYLVTAGEALAVVSRDADGDYVPGWHIHPDDGSVTSACMFGEDNVAIGLSHGVVMFGEISTGDAVRLQLAEGEGTYVKASRDDYICVFCQGNFFQVAPGDRSAGSLKPSRIAIDRELSSSTLMAFDGIRAVLRRGQNELTLVDLISGRCTDLRPRYATDPMGFTAAAISGDGNVVAVTCGSYLHTWRKERDADSAFISLPLMPQARGTSAAVSANGHYVAIGTAVGSVVIYTLVAPWDD